MAHWHPLPAIYGTELRRVGLAEDGDICICILTLYKARSHHNEIMGGARLSTVPEHHVTTIIALYCFVLSRCGYYICSIYEVNHPKYLPHTPTRSPTIYSL